MDSPLFGTWKMDGEEVFLVANGTDAVRLSGDILKRLSSVQGNKYKILGDEVIMDRYCDFKPVGRIGQKTRFKFNRTEKSLVLSRVSESGELINEEKWSLIEAEAIAAPAERESMPDLDSAEKYFERAEDQMKNGEFELPTKPGLGIELNKDVFAKYPYQPRDLDHFTPAREIVL